MKLKNKVRTKEDVALSRWPYFFKTIFSSSPSALSIGRCISTVVLSKCISTVVLSKFWSFFHISIMSSLFE